MKYTKVSSDAFRLLQMNAGIIVDSFTPATGAYGNILGATTGGITFNANPTYEDFGEDVDNVPANTKQLKRITSYDPVISGTFLTVNADLVKKLSGAGAINATTGTTLAKITPSQTLADSDFTDLWIVGDYTNQNDGNGAGFIAIHILNALNNTGFQLQTTKNGKGQFAFEFHGHYDLDDTDVVPYEIYVKGSASGYINVPTRVNVDAEGEGEIVEATVVGFTLDDTIGFSWASADETIATVSSEANEATIVGVDAADTTVTVTATGTDGLTRSAVIAVHVYVD